MIIIDGHNLIGHITDLSFSDPNVKEKLLNLLKKFHILTKKKIILVFDGHDQSYLERYIDEEIEIFYPEIGKNADYKICNLCYEYKNQRDTIIVTSDHEIQHVAKQYFLQIKTSKEFSQELQNTLKENDSIPITDNYLSIDETESWLNYFKKSK